jgi:hypothetical protein
LIRASNAYEDKREEILRTLRHYRSSVNNYQACKELYDSMFPSGTQMLTDMPRGGQDSFEPERWAIRRMNQSERMQASLDKMRDEYEAVEKLINSVDGNYNTVLTRKYLLNESWEVIAGKMHYSCTAVRNWHRRAIDHLIKVTPFDSLDVINL